MPLNREERKLLHQKSKEPTFGVGRPDNNSGNEGDLAFRQIEGSGTVEYLKQNNEWVAIASSGEMPKTRIIGKNIQSKIGEDNNHGKLSGLSDDDHKDYVRIGATSPRTGTGSLDLNTTTFDLDATGAVTLDSTSTVLISGDGGATFSDDTEALVYDGSGNVDFDAVALDIDTSGATTLTSTDNITIEALGADASNTKLIKIVGGSPETSGSTHLKHGKVSIESYATLTESGTTAVNYNSSGLHLIADADNVSSKQCNIFIEQKNTHGKGNSYGIDVLASNGIRIRSENTASGSGDAAKTNILMRATGYIDVGANVSSITPTNNDPIRTKFHGTTEIAGLYRPSDAVITTDLGTLNGDSASGVYSNFEALETQKLMRNFTYKATGSSISNDAYLTIVTAANDEDTDGTVWLVTVSFRAGINEGINVGYCFETNNTTVDPQTAGYVMQYFAGTGNGGEITFTAGNGIRWQNKTGATVEDAFASAQRIQGASDFS